MGSAPYIAAKISGFLHDEVFRLAALSATSGISLPLKCDESLVPSTSGLPRFEPAKLRRQPMQHADLSHAREDMDRS